MDGTAVETFFAPKYNVTVVSFSSDSGVFAHFEHQDSTNWKLKNIITNKFSIF